MISVIFSMPILPGHLKHSSDSTTSRTSPRRTNLDDIVLSYHDYLLRSSDVSLLKKNEWLNDNIIGFYFEYLQQQFTKNDKKQLLFIGPSLTQLLKGVVEEVSQYHIFFDPIDAKSYDFLFFPLNDCESIEAGGSHWSLLIFSRTEEMCYHFDSSCKMNSFVARVFAKKIIKYFLGKNETRYIEMDCPQQNNGYDCGLFVLCLADVISKCVLRASKITDCDCSIVTKMVPQKRNDLLKLIDDLKAEISTDV